MTRKFFGLLYAVLCPTREYLARKETFPLPVTVVCNFEDWAWHLWFLSREGPWLCTTPALTRDLSFCKTPPPPPIKSPCTNMMQYLIFISIDILVFFVGKYPDFYLLMTDTKNRSIYRMDLNTYSYETVPLHNHDNPISIDFDSLNQQIYWTDVGSNQIRTSSITGSNEKVVRQLGASKATIFYW